MKVASHIGPLIGGMLLVALANFVEHKFFPVVRDFAVTDIQLHERTLRVSGYMRKVRDCQFAGISATGYAPGSHAYDLPMTFRDGATNDNATRQTGSQAWGPWAINIPVRPGMTEINLTAVHRCHPAWATTTNLITLPIGAEK